MVFLEQVEQVAQNYFPGIDDLVIGFEVNKFNSSYGCLILKHVAKELMITALISLCLLSCSFGHKCKKERQTIIVNLNNNV